MTPPNTIVADYEVSSEGEISHWEIPISRLERVGNVLPSTTNSIPSRACAVTTGKAPYGVRLTGTILAQDTSGTECVVVDFTCGMVYKHQVRNVLTYNNGLETTFGALNIGDEVYYDRANANARLTTAPTDLNGFPNPLFGFVVPWSDADAGNYPKGTALAGSTQTCAIMQVGAGAEGSDGT
jgi:hypothetical protein